MSLNLQNHHQAKSQVMSETVTFPVKLCQSVLCRPSLPKEPAKSLEYISLLCSTRISYAHCLGNFLARKR